MVGAPADLSARPALGPRRHREAVAATREAMTEVPGRWGCGATAAPAFDVVIAHARATYAEFVGVTAADVATGHQVSPLVALIAASLPPGAEVLVPDGEFTSVTFPFAVQPELRVRQVPLADLADQITGDTDWWRSRRCSPSAARWPISMPSNSLPPGTTPTSSST